MGEEHFDLLCARLSRWVELGGRALPGEVSDDLIFLATDRTRFSVGQHFAFRRAVPYSQISVPDICVAFQTGAFRAGSE